MTTMIQGAFVLKMKTREWRMCVVKQVPEQSASSFMLFGQGTNQGTNQGTKNKDKTTFQMEFKPSQETMLIQHMANMGNMGNMGAEIRLVLVTDAPAVSCIGSLWSSKGLEMYRRELYTETALVNSLHQDMNMLNLSPQVAKPVTKQVTKPRHSMQTRSKTLN